MSLEIHRARAAETQAQISSDTHAPKLGVHVMSEFVFCPRAGILAFEAGMDDYGSEFIPAPALGGLPSYNVDLIEAKLEQLTATLRRIIILFAAVTGAMGVISLLAPLLATVLSASALLGATISGHLFWWRVLAEYFKHKTWLRDARRAVPREPNWSRRAQQAVNWWELLKAGFDSRQLNESLHEQRANIQGRPWRILHKADMHIPVIQMSIPDFDPDRPTQVRFRDQQRARMAAYAYLVETCQRGRADWVIVLINGSVDGVAIPLNQREWQAFKNGLETARRVVARLATESNHVPPPADGQNACVNCPLGKPRVIGVRPTLQFGVELPPHLTTDRDEKRLFHSTCGDRFQDIPPHKDAEALGLHDF